jgi:hypothetical protein
VPRRARTRCSRPSARPGAPRSSDAAGRATARRTRLVAVARHRALHRDHRRPEPAPLRRGGAQRAASAGSSCRAASRAGS